jgi:hypothetical protein
VKDHVDAEVEIEVPALGRMRGVAVDVGPAGSRAAMVLRPEHLRIAGATGGAENSIALKVTQVVFFGQHVRVNLVHASGATFFTHVAAGEGEAVPAINSEILLHWAARNARVYAAE